MAQRGLLLRVECKINSVGVPLLWRLDDGQELLGIIFFNERDLLFFRPNRGDGRPFLFNRHIK